MPTQLTPGPSLYPYNEAALRGFGRRRRRRSISWGRVKKGSKAAKRRMAYLRALRGHGVPAI